MHNLARDRNLNYNRGWLEVHWPGAVFIGSVWAGRRVGERGVTGKSHSGAEHERVKAAIASTQLGPPVKEASGLAAADVERVGSKGFKKHVEKIIWWTKHRATESSKLHSHFEVGSNTRNSCFWPLSLALVVPIGLAKFPSWRILYPNGFNFLNSDSVLVTLLKLSSLDLPRTSGLNVHRLLGSFLESRRNGIDLKGFKRGKRASDKDRYHRAFSLKFPACTPHHYNLKPFFYASFTYLVSDSKYKYIRTLLPVAVSEFQFSGGWEWKWVAGAAGAGSAPIANASVSEKGNSNSKESSRGHWLCLLLPALASEWVLSSPLMMSGTISPGEEHVKLISFEIDLVIAATAAFEAKAPPASP
ncbi:hypothetical protein GALMADRAFT_217604 [Galerina marginata CBS 339.88]|uniref:Uncharacterized protein n=1 Tax=Galerina marginata (strain CBS 339.88) TaxID=685588 RepID=A0A067SEV3_GALM3|nr:hypothetical protein GALMADRAFT_217604 [Galerina marginata CBS 339.88]